MSKGRKILELTIFLSFLAFFEQSCLPPGPESAVSLPEQIPIQQAKVDPAFSTTQMKIIALLPFSNARQQDYITARFLFVFSQYRGININFVDKKVRLIDTLDYQQYNIRVEMLKSSFVSFYNILDKIACFIKDYLNLDHGSQKNVYFSDVWYKGLRSKNGVHEKIVETKNYFLNALYNMHRDIEKGQQEKLKGIRHKLTHSFLNIYWMAGLEDKKMTERTLFEDTLSLSKIVRNAVIYLLKFVYVEETKKEKTNNNLALPIFWMEIPDKFKNIM